MDLKDIVQYTHGLSMLYIEDDVQEREHMISMLDGLFNCVDSAADGQQGLDLYNSYYTGHSQYYDLLLIDIELPKINGISLSEAILKIHPQQHIIVISAYNDKEKLAKLLNIGIDNFLHKPIEYKNFFSILLKSTKIITEQKFILSKLDNIQEINYNLEAVMDIINQVAIVSKTDLEGNITYVNDIFCQTSKYTKEELIGQNHNILRHPDMPSILFKQMWEEIQSGKIWKGKLKNRDKNSHAYYVNANIFPILDKQGKIQEYIAIRFLTTEDEIKSRDFKKKVIEQYQESKRRDFTSRSKINELEQKLIKYENFDLLEFSLKKAKKKSLECTSQLKFTENSYKKLEEHLEKYKQSITKNVSAIIEKNKRLQVKNDLYLKKIDSLDKEIRAREEEFNRMNQNNDLRAKEMENLRDVINHLENKK